MGGDQTFDSNDPSSRVVTPMAYSWTIGEAEAAPITLVTLPAGYTIGRINSVTINATGNVVMGGYAQKVKISKEQIPLAYSWKTGTATQITTPLPAESTSGTIRSVAINAGGKAIMGGKANKGDVLTSFPLAYSWNTGETTASQITTALPGGTLEGLLYSVAIDAAGNAVMGGQAFKDDLSIYIPLAYSWNTGDASTIETPPPYHEYPVGSLRSVAITSDGKAIMGGYSYYLTPNTGGAFLGGAFYQQPFQQ